MTLAPDHGHSWTLHQDLLGTKIDRKCLETDFFGPRRPPIEKRQKQKLLHTLENGGTDHIKSGFRGTSRHILPSLKRFNMNC